MIKFPLSVVIGAVDKWTAPLSAMQTKLNKTFAPMRELTAKTAALGEAAGVRKLGKAFAGVGDALSNVTRQAFQFFGMLAGAHGVVGALGFAIFRLASSTAELGDRVSITAKKLGVPVRLLQELQYAAKLVDMEDAELSQSLEMLSRRLGEAGLGSKSAARGFDMLGIDIRDSSNRIRPMGDVLEDLADRLGAVRDQGLRNAISSMIFSRSWGKIAPLLQGGSKFLREAAVEAHELNVVMSDEAIEASSRFDDANKRMRAAMIGTRNAIGLQLIPPLTELLGKIKDFVVKHRSEIENYARRFAAGLPERLEKLWGHMESTMKVVRRLAGWVGFLFDKFGEGPVIITALAAAFTVTLVPAIAATVVAFKTLGIAMFATPVGLWITAIAAVIVLIWALVKNWDRVCAGIKATGIGIWKSITGFFKDSWRLIKSNLSDIAIFWEDLWDQIVFKFERARKWITDKVKAVGSIIPDWMKGGGETKVSFKGGPPSPMPERVARAVAAAGGANGRASVKVEFANAPKGMRVTETSSKDTDLDLRLGYTMMAGN